LDTDITNYPIDSDGYPNPLADTQEELNAQIIDMFNR
jgi:hypothetical protein